MRIAGIVLFTFLAPSLPDNPKKVAITVLAGIILLFSSWEGKTKLDRPIFIFLWLGLLSTLMAWYPLFSFLPTLDRGDGFLVWIVYGLGALQAARLTQVQAQRVILGLLIWGAAQSLLADLESVGFVPRLSTMVPYNLHGYGTLGSTVFLAGTLALLLPISESLGQWILSVFMVGGLWVANEKMGWIAAILGVGLLQRRRWIYLGIVLGMGVALWYFHSRLFMANYLFALEDRLWIWGRAIEAIDLRPWFGHGLSTMHVFGAHFELSQDIDNPHNEVLYILYSFGVFALIAYLWIWRTAIASLWRIRTDKYAFGMLAGLAAYAVWVMFEWTPIGVANVLWTLFGLSISLDRPAPIVVKSNQFKQEVTE